MLFIVLAVVLVVLIILGYVVYAAVLQPPSAPTTQTNQGGHPHKHHHPHPQPTPTVSPTPQPIGNACTGVTKNGQTYTFSWLHVSSQGIVQDQNNCYVPLVGFNLGALDEQNGSIGVDLPTNQWVNSTFHMNVARVVFNAYWYDTNVYVPNKAEHFQQVLTDFVSELESIGDYVELDPYTNFHTPPCGNDHQGVDISFCPPQDYGSILYKQNASPSNFQQTFMYAPPIIQAWQSLAARYKNDPAVLYDTMNEPIAPSPTYWSDIKTIIQTIQTINPRALLIAFGRDWPSIASGQQTAYDNVPNLLIDFHIYDGFQGTGATGQQCNEPGTLDQDLRTTHFSDTVNFAHQHGWGVIINEWGGCMDLPTYNAGIIWAAQTLHVALVYFHGGDIGTPRTNLNSNGKLVQPAYSSLLP